MNATSPAAHPFEIRTDADGWAEVWVRVFVAPSLERGQAWIMSALDGVQWGAHDIGTFREVRHE